jgi:hypothetical protein
MGSGQVKDWQAGTCTPSGYAACIRCDGVGRTIIRDGVHEPAYGARWNDTVLELPDDEAAA